MTEPERQLWIALVAAFAAADPSDTPERCSYRADHFVVRLSTHPALAVSISLSGPPICGRQETGADLPKIT